MKINRLRWETITKYLNGKGSVLDWGCGTGSFLRHIGNGYDVYGYDVNKYSPYRDKSVVAFGYDAVTLWDVLEHMASPRAFLSSLNTKYLFILTPDASSLDGKLKGWVHYKPDEHQHFFTKESITRCLEFSGFRVIEMNHEEGALRNPKHPEWLMTVVGERV